MTATNINIGFGSELEARAQSVLADLGLDVPTAITIFLTQIVETKALPYDLRVEKKPKMTREEAFGCARGQFNIPDDFDEPLEDFREYME
jgi:addiction module RelB/DinJ family antitoxin